MKKSYLASIESLDDADDDTDDDSFGIIIGMNHSSSTERSTSLRNTNSCENINVNHHNQSVFDKRGNINSDFDHLLQSSTPKSTHSSSKQQDDHDNDIPSIDDHKSSTFPNDECNSSFSKYCDPNLSHIDRVIYEIVETERTYVKDLHEIIEGYLNYLNCLNGSKMSNEEIMNLFSNIKEIHNFNSNFLSQLEECGLEPVAIAKCFLKNGSGFNIYSEYCTNYPRTVSLLTEMMRNSETAEILKERQITLKQSLPLGSYLLKPVQRILKYHLLLQNIVKYSDKDSIDYVDIKNALSVMTNIAYYINEMKRKHEHSVRVQEIQSLLYNWEGQDLTTYGDLQCEGSFRMLGAKALRHLFLFDKMLLITKKKEEGNLSYKAHIMCSNLMLIEIIQGEPLCFHAIPFDNPRVQYTFQARNLEQKREWCLLLKRVIIENYNVVIPSHAKQIVMELGQTIYSENEKSHRGSKRTLSAPEYLERRKQERRKSEVTINQNLHKGFKLRKSLKKIQSLDSNNGSRRARSASHDESVHSNGKRDDNCERRSSLGVMELCASSNNSTLKGEKFESNIAPTATSTQPTPKQVSKTCIIQDKLTNDIKNDTKNIINLSNNATNMRPPTRTMRMVQKESNDFENRNEVQLNDENGLNYLMSSTSSLMRTSTPLSSGSSELSMASSSQSEDAKYVVLPVNALLSATSDSSSSFLRRVHSFTGMTRTKAMIQHTSSFRISPSHELPSNLSSKCSPQRPTTLDLNKSPLSSLVQLPTSSSLDEMSPTAPAIWLKRQEEHFAEACKKAGSLPRSFESNAFDDSEETSLVNLISTPNQQRPFTIVSDKLSKVDFIDGNLDSYIDDESNKKTLNSEDKTDDNFFNSENSNNFDSISTHGVHLPDHKIYRQSASKYLKSMFYSVGSKFVSLRKSPTCSDNSNDGSSVVSGESGDRCESPAPEQKQRSASTNKVLETSKFSENTKLITSRFVHSLAKAYSNIIKHKLRNPKESSLPSKTLAEMLSPVLARITIDNSTTNSNDDYSQTPKRIGLQRRLFTNGNRRPDSLLSEVSSETTDGSLSRSGSNAEEHSCYNKSQDLQNSNFNESSFNDDDSPSDESESSIDSFFERTIEAFESVLAEEMFRDSAIYSDQEDQESSSCGNEDFTENSLYTLSNDEKLLEQEHIDKMKFSNIELLCAKRVKSAIIERLKILEENAQFHRDMNCVNFDGLKSIKERRQELFENCCKTNNQNRNDQDDQDDQSNNKDLIEQTYLEDNPTPNTRGWVKHVIGKLQNDNEN